MSEGPQLLLVEDELQMRRFLRVTLAGEGYRLVEASTGQQAEVLARQWNPELILLDLGLPDIDGVQVLASLRRWSKVPVIVLSARGSEHDKVAALDLGADDYLTKPFSSAELLARIRVALRNRARTDAAETAVAWGDVRVDLVRRLVSRAGQEVHLTPLEYKLLATLCRHAGRAITHRQLLVEVWGPGAASQTHYLRVYMTQLRHKLEADPARPQWLTTESGVGYRLRA